MDSLENQTGLPHGLGFVQSPPDNRDILLAHHMAEFAFPYSFHLYKTRRRKDLPVLDQGKEPACVGYSGAALKISHERKDHRHTINFDGLELYEPIALPGGGAYVRDLMKYLKETGARNPHNNNRYCIDAYTRIETWDLYALKRAIYAVGPVVAGIKIYENFLTSGEEYTETKGRLIGGHAILVIGWRKKDGTTQYLLHNSWGNQWGENGQVWVEETVLDSIAMEYWSVVDRVDEWFEHVVSFQDIIKTAKALEAK